MAQRTVRIASLSELIDGQEADFFALLSVKQLLRTKRGDPYYRVAFRDHEREISFPVWSNSAWYAECRDAWSAGECYKLRAVYRETENFGPQLEIDRIRPATDEDRGDGFDPAMFQPQSRFAPGAMFDELVELAREHIKCDDLRALVESILSNNRQALLVLPAASRNHHAFAGGWLEHVLSVARTAVYLAEKYAAAYPDMRPPLDTSLVVAGAVLHDVGKLRELEPGPAGAGYTSEGSLVGHVLQGRDIVREAAADAALAAETLLRLEHIIVSHQRLPEWGSPKPPMTPEALLVHFADEIDAKYQMMYRILAEDESDGSVTSGRNVLGYAVFRGSA